MQNRTLLYPIIAGLLVAALAVGVYILGSIFLPVFLSLVLAYLCDPMVTRLERWRVSRPVAVAIVFSGVLALLAGVAWFYAVSLREEFRHVQLNLPEYASRLYSMIPGPIKAAAGIETPEKAYERVRLILDRVAGASFEIVRESFAVVKKAFTSTLSFVLALLGYGIIPIYLYYFLLDLPKMRDALLELVPPRYRGGFSARCGEIQELLAAFVRGQLSVCLILAILYSLGLYLIGIDLAVVIGTLAGITFIIPYVGTILGIALSVAMALLKFHDLLHPLLCVGWFLLVQALEGGVITPRLVGNKVGLHPVITIIALLVGGQLFGIIGMIMAVPVTAVLKVFIRVLRERYLQSGFYREVA